MTAIFLTTRVNSTRLPRKPLLEINSETVTYILIKRLKKTGIPIVMTVPDTLGDHKHLQPIADRQDIEFFAGDFLPFKRHKQAAEKYGVDYIILSEGDDFLACPETFNAVYYKAKELKFKRSVVTEGLPFGMNVISYPVENLNINFSSDTGWGKYVTKDAHILKFNYDRPYRLSMDTADDFEIMKDVYLNCKRNEFVGGIVKYMDGRKL